MAATDVIYFQFGPQLASGQLRRFLHRAKATTFPSAGSQSLLCWFGPLEDPPYEAPANSRTEPSFQRDLIRHALSDVEIPRVYANREFFDNFGKIVEDDANWATGSNAASMRSSKIAIGEGVRLQRRGVGKIDLRLLLQQPQKRGVG